MSISQSITGEILLKFQLMQGEIKEIQENLGKLNTQMVKFCDLIDGVIRDFKQLDEEKVFGTV